MSSSEVKFCHWQVTIEYTQATSRRFACLRNVKIAYEMLRQFSYINLRNS